MKRPNLRLKPLYNPPKQKKCKGTGEAIGYGCGTPNTERQLGLGKKECRCYVDWLFNSDAGKARMSRAVIKATSPRLDLEKAQEEKRDRTKLSYLLVNVRNICHEYIRKRDQGKPCISCDALWNPDFQAGHFYKAELYSTIKHHEFNINGQCKICNLRKDGNESGYRTGFLRRYGIDALMLLDDLADTGRQTTHKWNREDLEATRKYYQEKLKSL